MMDAQLLDVHERGESIAALWASEETIYGRFGYGIASWAGSLTVQHEWDAFAGPLEPVGTTRFVAPEEARKLFPAVYDAVRRERPGMTSRNDVWWEERHLRLEEDENDAPGRCGVREPNDGRWRLEDGVCERTDAEPALALDVSALGSAYLGAVSFTQLRQALRVQELREGAVARADALFAWRPLPWCLEIF